MQTSQFIKVILLLSALLCLSSCFVSSKKFNINDIPEFGESGCVINKADAFFSFPQSGQGKYGSMNFFAPDEKVPEFLRRWPIYKGTQIKIDKVETTNDFHNGDRLIIWGTVSINSKEYSFLTQRYFLDEPDAKAHFLKYFSPC